MVSPASSASEWQDMLSGRLPMREVRAWGKRLAYEGMFRDTLHHIMTDGDSRMAEMPLGFSPMRIPMFCQTSRHTT